MVSVRAKTWQSIIVGVLIDDILHVIVTGWKHCGQMLRASGVQVCLLKRLLLTVGGKPNLCEREAD